MGIGRDLSNFLAKRSRPASNLDPVAGVLGMWGGVLKMEIEKTYTE